MTAHISYQLGDNEKLLSAIQTEVAKEKNLIHIRSKSFKKNEYIYLSQTLPSDIFVIQKGRVKIGSHQEGPKEIIKNVLQKGAFFGELSMIGSPNRIHFSMAMEDTTLYVLSKETFQQLIKNHPSLVSFLLKELGKRLVDMEDRLESLVFRNSRSRVIDFLSTQVRKRGQRVGYEMLVRGFFTHQEIANLTATSRQTVTTVLNELRSKNILTSNRRRLLIRDMDLLIKEAA